MKTFTLILTLLLSIMVFKRSWAQFEIDEPILMVSPNEEDRQVKGLDNAVESDNAVNAVTLLNATLIFDEATGNDQILIDLLPAPNNYSAGMMLTFAPDAPNSGPATLNVNGLGLISIKKNISEDLDSADLQPNIPVTVIFDGSVFQVLGQYSAACPQGYLEMTRDYCIEAQSRPAGNFWTATRSCAQEGARLCTFGEWHYACRMDQLFFNSILDYEWLDHAANNVRDAKRVGVDLNGDADCYKGGTSNPTSILPYRCCYTK